MKDLLEIYDRVAMVALQDIYNNYCHGTEREIIVRWAFDMADEYMKQREERIQKLMA